MSKCTHVYLHDLSNSYDDESSDIALYTLSKNIQIRERTSYRSPNITEPTAVTIQAVNIPREFDRPISNLYPPDSCSSL